MVRVQPLGCDFALDAPARNRDWYESRGYESMSTAVFRTVARGASAVIDIGAHVGYYSLVARSADPQTPIVAIEASPDNAAVLLANVAGANGSAITVMNAAFGAVTGTATIFLTEASDNCGLSGHPNSPTTRTEEVAAITGADLGLAGGGRLLIKLDVEGHEIAALDGLGGLFQSYDDVRLLVEFNPKCLLAAGSSPDGLVDRLHVEGFRIFVLDEVLMTWTELTEGRPWGELVDARGYANFYCVPRERSITLAVAMHSGGVGGAERSHAEMTEALIRAGGMIHTIAPEPDLGLRDTLHALGGSVSLVEPFQWWMTWPDDVVAEGEAETWTRRLVHVPLIDEITRVAPDVVMTQSGVIPQGAIAAAATGRPHVWYLREFGDLDHGLTVPGGPRAAGGIIHAMSDVVVTNSAAVREHFFGEDDRVVVLHPAPTVGAEVVRDAEQRPWTLGIVASLNRGKGQEDALEALAQLRHEGTDVPLVLVGPAAEPDRERILLLAEQLGIEDLVTVAGASRERSSVYSQLDAVAVTSRAEAFGRIPFEATAVGLPVIYSDTGGPREYMEPGTTGLAYPPGDTSALASAIRTLRADPALSDALVAAARRSLLSTDRQDTFGASLATMLRAARDSAAPRDMRLVASWLSATVAEGTRELDAVRRDLNDVIAAHEELVPRYHELVREHDVLVTGHLGIVEAFDAAKVERAETFRQLEEVSLIAAQSRNNNRVLRSSIADLQADLSAAVSTQENLGAQLIEARTRVDALRQEAGELHRQKELIERSRVWRARTRLVSVLRPVRRR